MNGIDALTKGSRGGLSLAWNGNDIISIQSFSNHHIDAFITDINIVKRWRLTGFYGYLDSRDENRSWDLIRHLLGQCDLPWVIFGDFNEILYSHEKSGGIPRDDSRMENFRKVLNDCGLVDGGFSGPYFTWERENLPKTNISDRLNRGVMNLY